MEWIVKIEGRTNQRIRIVFDPLHRILHFFGEYKPKNQEWVVFNTVETGIILTKEILKMIENVDSVMNKTIEIYNNVSEILKPMKENGVKIEED